MDARIKCLHTHRACIYIYMYNICILFSLHLHTQRHLYIHIQYRNACLCLCVYVYVHAGGHAYTHARSHDETRNFRPGLDASTGRRWWKVDPQLMISPGCFRRSNCWFQQDAKSPPHGFAWKYTQFLPQFLAGPNIFWVVRWYACDPMNSREHHEHTWVSIVLLASVW